MQNIFSGCCCNARIYFWRFWRKFWWHFSGAYSTLVVQNNCLFLYIIEYFKIGYQNFIYLPYLVVKNGIKRENIGIKGEIISLQSFPGVFWGNKWQFWIQKPGRPGRSRSLTPDFLLEGRTDCWYHWMKGLAVSKHTHHHDYSSRGKETITKRQDEIAICQVHGIRGHRLRGSLIRFHLIPCSMWRSSGPFHLTLFQHGSLALGVHGLPAGFALFPRSPALSWKRIGTNLPGHQGVDQGGQEPADRSQG